MGHGTAAMIFLNRGKPTMASFAGYQNLEGMEKSALGQNDRKSFVFTT